MKKPVAVLFDLDGVLWMSTPVHEKAFRDVLRHEGIRHFRYQTVAGMSTRGAMKRLLADAGRKVGSGRVDELSAEKSRLAFRSLTKRPPIRRGALAFLKRLARRHRLALVSSGSRKTVGLFLRKSRSRKVFSIVITSDHVRRAKPFPDIYLKALRTLRLKAHDAVVIEDAVSGVRAARRAKIRVIAVTGTDSAARLRAAGALAVCRSLREVEKRVDRL